MEGGEEGKEGAGEGMKNREEGMEGELGGGRGPLPGKTKITMLLFEWWIPPANIKTAGGYTASNIRQASLELGGVPIPLFDVGLGGILKGSHPHLSYIRNRTCDSA